MDYFNEGVVFMKFILFLADCLWILLNGSQKKISDLDTFYFGFGLALTGPRIIETERSVGAVS